MPPAEDARPAPPPGLGPLTGTDPARIGPYRVAGRLGAGGMGAVYAALDDRDTCLAVKVVHREYAADPVFRARFAREVELVGRVRAACTARFVAADTTAERPWLATEYVPGPTLRQRVRERGPLAGGMLVALAAGVAEALHAVHAAGIVHRDLKPGNLILAPDGPKVLDFGIARAVDESGITRTGGLVGTPGWVAPERYEGAEATALSDVFAWGAVVALAATGRNPFGGGQAQTVAYRTLREEPDLDGVPGELLPLVRRAMAKDPAARPGTAELLRALAPGPEAARGAADEEPTRMVTRLLRQEWHGAAEPGTAHDPASWTALAPPRRRRAPLVAASVAAVLVVAAGGAYASGLTPVAPPGGGLFDAAAEDPGTGGEGEGQGEGGPGTGEGEPPPAASPSQAPAGIPGMETLAAQGPGVFRHTSAEGRARYEITLESAAAAGAGTEFRGAVEYLGDSGELALSTADFFVPDRAAVADPVVDAADVPEAARAYPAPQAEIGTVSPAQPRREFSFAVPAQGPGALVFDPEGDLPAPHLCFRTDRPYADTGTDFLNNHWRAWDMCADGDATYD
ncbi:serine/threonine protein kinase [Streptomonospora sp. S1-112]|uniref:Serine/threonine protein kinase n=1 Tax=Streptomonospora mangrovi TaxID=2883123 RepID=A0A9X3NQ72_9ACTN|nr:serine/threonine-protein kinase [Streptomonospora mangrovi]MDA0567862.1 serine/threonine protein kinase [Streptomonospora mangrovi]